MRQSKARRSKVRLLVMLSVVLGLFATTVLPVLAAEADVEVAWTCETGLIEVSSTKGISNVVLVVDGVDVRWFEAPPEQDEIRDYTIDPETVDGVVSGVYVKSGSNSDAGDNGLGEYFPLAAPDCGPICEPYVQIADPELEAVIREFLRAPDGPITPEMTGYLTSLSATGRGITTLDGIGCFTNLRSLNLAGNQISDVSELGLLTQLVILILDINRVSDVTPLAGLIQLRNLSLGQNLISDISSLDGLELLSFNVSKNSISDISVVARYENLQVFAADGNQVVDLDPLSEKIFLRFVFLADNQISDVSPLLNVQSLAQVDLRGNPLDCSDPDLLTLFEEVSVVSDCAFES